MQHLLCDCKRMFLCKCNGPLLFIIFRNLIGLQCSVPSEKWQRFYLKFRRRGLHLAGAVVVLLQSFLLALLSLYLFIDF